VPTAVKHQRELGDDVQVIFVECQGADRDTYEAFAWKMKWMGNSAVWTDERPIPTTGTGLPETALIGVDGKVILQGHPGMLGKKLEDALTAEIKKSKQAPEGTSNDLKKAWGMFAKGDVAGAIAECDQVATDEASAAKAEFVARTVAKIERIKRMVDAGELHEASQLAGALEKSVKANVDLAAKLAEQTARIADPAMESEREASKALAALLDKIAVDKPFDAGNVKKVAALAAKYPGTKSAARAERFVELSKRKVDR